MSVWIYFLLGWCAGIGTSLVLVTFTVVAVKRRMRVPLPTGSYTSSGIPMKR